MSNRAVKNVLISGASIAGPALAFWLTRYGINTTVVEKASSLRGGGYPIDIRGTALDAVERMGLYPQMRAAHVDSQSVAFVDAYGAVSRRSIRRRSPVASGAGTSRSAAAISQRSSTPLRRTRRTTNSTIPSRHWQSMRTAWT
jgi:2-polyprenyl-6-methoxyphenol hydroxylase-like FAD-dependent oxidoreductase